MALPSNSGRFAFWKHSENVGTSCRMSSSEFLLADIRLFLSDACSSFSLQCSTNTLASLEHYTPALIAPTSDLLCRRNSTFSRHMNAHSHDPTESYMFASIPIAARTAVLGICMGTVWSCPFRNKIESYAKKLFSYTIYACRKQQMSYNERPSIHWNTCKGNLW